MEFLIIILILGVIAFLFLIANVKSTSSTYSSTHKNDDLNKIYTEYEKSKEEQLAEINLRAQNEIDKKLSEAKLIIDELDKLYDSENAIECNVAGIFHRTENAKLEARCLKPGEEVKLSLDEKNIHDPFAVKVKSDGFHIGFIPADQSKQIYGVIKNGKGFRPFVSSNITRFNSSYMDYDIHLSIKLYPK